MIEGLDVAGYFVVKGVKWVGIGENELNFISWQYPRQDHS
jgi:hypothetical protein